MNKPSLLRDKRCNCGRIVEYARRSYNDLADTGVKRIHKTTYICYYNFDLSYAVRSGTNRIVRRAGVTIEQCFNGRTIDEVLLAGNERREVWWATRVFRINFTKLVSQGNGPNGWRGIVRIKFTTPENRLPLSAGTRPKRIGLGGAAGRERTAISIVTIIVTPFRK